MPEKTDLSVSPYNDDFDEAKRFHKILFKPRVAVQTREINQLQSILQNQIERFGNNIFKRGTIIDGVNFIFYSSYPYAKILDTQVDNALAVPSNYVGLFAKNANNLTAYVNDSADGFESTSPDLKTIYLQYTNSGDSYSDTSFTPGEVLTLYDGNNSVSSISVTVSGTGYSNSDLVVVTPVMLVNVTSGSFSVGDVINNPLTNANGVITSITDESVRTARITLGGTASITASQVNVIGTGTTFSVDFANGDYVALYSNSSSYITRKVNVVANATFMNLTTNSTFTNATASYANTTDSRSYVRYKPVASALSNISSTSVKWTYSVDDIVLGATASDIFEVVDVIGENAAAEIVTDSVGRVTDCDVTNQGTGYTSVPFVSVRSQGSGVVFDPKNYYAQVTIAASAGSVGSGYAFGVTEGYIYQKGYFVKVEPQTIIVDRYSSEPDDVTVGFVTSEEIVTSNIDSSLLDNVTGYPNLNAPGADRLKLTANLTVSAIDGASADPEFFNLVEWSEGRPYKQNNRTFYNVVADQAADRTHDVSGNFVVDRFLVSTTTPSNTSLLANTINVVVDPGTAYVDGYKIQTVGNYVLSSSKSIDTKVEEDVKISLNYGNYIRVNNLGGYFEFDQCNSVDLYNTAKGFGANNAAIIASDLAPTGTKIGTARLRNFVFEQGTPGTPNAVYRLYLFNIQMSAGNNFRDVRTVYYDGAAADGIADLVLEFEGSSSSNTAILYGKNSKMMFYGGFASPLNANNISYTYRTVDTASDIANTGIITLSLSGSPGKTFPYVGTLTDSQKSEIYVAPTANLIAFANLTGTVNVSSSTSNVLGNSTSFITEVEAGQYINVIGGASNNMIRRVVSVTNSSHMVVDSNSAFTQTAVNAKRCWPANIPIPLGYSNGITANVNGTYDTLNINLGKTLNVSTNTDVIMAYSVAVANATPTVKTPNREMLVKLRLANNASTTVGPWCLGVPDIFRLRNVYKGSSTVNTASSDVTGDFFIDNNQASNFYNLGYLYKKNQSSLVLTDDDYLLVKFDCFTASAGFYNITSYVSGNAATRFIEDSKPLANLSSTVNTLEIPELYDALGNYYDLMNQVDFRPYVTATANITSNTINVTLNPANTMAYSAVDRTFPVPDSVYVHDVERFTSRVDAIVLNKDGRIKVVNGNPDSPIPPAVQGGAMRLNDVFMPEYPSVPEKISSTLGALIATNVFSDKYSAQRLNARKIKTLFTETDFNLQQPMRHTEVEIGSIERRVSDLEYYVGLSFVQSAIKDRVIPSALSTTVNRFKYGFFVDNYSNTAFSETESPEYVSTVIDDFAQPLLVAFNTVHRGDGFTSSPYSTVKIVTQDLATEDPPPPPPPPPKQYVGGMRITPPYFKTQSFSAASATSTTSSAPPPASHKIVCTAMNEAYGFGSFRNALWVEQSKGLAPEYEKGYHALFLPLVDFVYRSEHRDSALANAIRVVGEHVVRHRTADIWAQKRGRRDTLGAVYRAILEPACFAAGWLKKGDK